MIRKAFVGGLLGILFTIPVFGQEATQEAMLMLGAPPLVNTVDTVVAQVTPENTLEILVTGRLLDGCQADTQISTERVGDVWFVDLFRNVPAETPCTKAILPFETQVDATELLTLDAEATLPTLMVVNGVAFRINRAMVDPIAGTTVTLIVPPLFEQLATAQVMLDKVTLTRTENSLWEVRAVGNLNDSCQMLVARTYPYYQNPTVEMVEVYSVFGLADMCAMGLVPFDRVLTTAADAALVTQFVINGVTYTPDPTLNTNSQTFIEVPITVTVTNTAVLETMPPQIALTIQGTLDGCPQPPQIVVAKPVDNSVTVKVVRVLPENQPCTMIALAYEDQIIIPTSSFVPGTIMIYINNGEPVSVEF